MSHARWLRGAVIQRARRPEFHHHDDEGVIYQHPLIRYDVSSGCAELAGLAEGALLLRSLPAFEAFTLGRETLSVRQRSVEMGRVEVGPTAVPIRYTLQTPYLALNQENYHDWERGSYSERKRLLSRIVIGNVLSLSKAIGLHVSERLYAEVDLEPCGLQTLKPGVELLGFRGSIRVNLRLPTRWGIGKSSARGFGTLIAEEA
jgi:hypothetical protein